jgi:protein-S-isoprenylcysteine O-methyltransferase Ste14
LGLSFFSWAFLGLFFSKTEDRFTAVRICLALLHAVIGILIIVRRAVKLETSIKGILYSVPSIILSGTAFKLSVLPHLWPLYSNIIFIFGACTAVLSYFFLGRNTAVFPSLREISVNGPYRFIRHPVYAGEFIMIAACCLSVISVVSVLIIFLSALSIIVRINAEESVLIQSENYKDYIKKVKYRILPYIF